jgi:hypothetical protein
MNKENYVLKIDDIKGTRGGDPYNKDPTYKSSGVK